jgi:hypothetical protein
MAKKIDKIKSKVYGDCHCGYGHHGSSHAIYGLGFIGAAVYFIGQATTFWMGVLGILKAIVWPVFVVFGLLKFLGM